MSVTVASSYAFIIVSYSDIGTIKQVQLAGIQHNREVIARYRALAKTPRACRCARLFCGFPLTPSLQWATKTPSRSSYRPASRKLWLSRTEILASRTPAKRNTEDAPLQLCNDLLFFLRLRILPLPCLCPFNHPRDERLHLLSRVARMQAYPYTFPTFGHGGPCDWAGIQAARTQVGG